MKKKQPNQFELALAARTGKLEPNAITKAARLLFRDNTISNAELERYAAGPQKKQHSQFSDSKPQITAKRS